MILTEEKLWSFLTRAPEENLSLGSWCQHLPQIQNMITAYKYKLYTVHVHVYMYTCTCTCISELSILQYNNNDNHDTDKYDCWVNHKTVSQPSNEIDDSLIKKDKMVDIPLKYLLLRDSIIYN